MSEVQQGSSLARDAWLRFRKNRLSMAGAIYVCIVAALGFSAPLFAEYVTHFSYDEQHTDFSLMPPGTQDLSKDFPSYDGDVSHFDRLDRNGDGFIGGEQELRELYWIGRFLGFLFDDYDLVSEGDVLDAAHRAKKHPDGWITLPEYPKDYSEMNKSLQGEFTAVIQVNFPPEDQWDSARIEAAAAKWYSDLGLDRKDGFKPLDLNEDGALEQTEVNTYRLAYRPFESTADAIKAMDTDGDGMISRDEYPGAPVLRTFWLGTDNLGRDVLTRILYGARISITIALAATFVSFLIGISWGSIAGYYGGRVDSIMMRIVDVLYGLPFMFIVILLIVIFGRSTLNLFIALGAVQWLTMSRVVRGQVLSLKNREFIEAAVAIGVPRIKIVFKHLLRNTVGPVIVYSTLMIPAIILQEAFLSFLGLGVQPPEPSWGNMITDGARVMDSHAWLILYPGVALSLTLFCMNFVGDGLRDALDPQMQKD